MNSAERETELLIILSSTDNGDGKDGATFLFFLRADYTAAVNAASSESQPISEIKKK